MTEVAHLFFLWDGSEKQKERTVEEKKSDVEKRERESE